MRRLTLVAVVGALFLLMTSGVASAEVDMTKPETDPIVTIPSMPSTPAPAGEDTPGRTRFEGTPRGDRVNFSTFRNDRDTARTRGGSDRVNARDGDKRDRIRCGPGKRDNVRADRGDRVAKNCERVRDGRGGR